MDFQIRISETALADLQEILAYSWAYFPDTTERFGAGIPDHIELLRAFPYVGSPVRGRGGVRCIVHTPVLIFYRLSEDEGVAEILAPAPCIATLSSVCPASVQ